jgi:hypothetical protein
VNPRNVERDTSVDRVLLSQRFVYYGERARRIPDQFRSFGNEARDVCLARQGHGVFTGGLRDAFVAWLEATHVEWGVLGPPAEFRHHTPTRAIR